MANSPRKADFRTAGKVIAAPRPDRAGKRLIAGHFDEAVARRLKVLAAMQGRTVNALLSDAIELLFAKYEPAPATRRRVPTR